MIQIYSHIGIQMLYSESVHLNLRFFIGHPSVEKDLSLKIEVRDQTIWTSTLEL